MSFRCAHCQNAVAPKTPVKRVVTATRPVTYFRLVNGRKEVMGNGTEIVKEEKLCPECAQLPIVVTVGAPKTTVIKVVRPKVEREDEHFEEGKESRRKRAA